jgi:hypothetical protein
MREVLTLTTGEESTGAMKFLVAAVLRTCRFDEILKIHNGQTGHRRQAVTLPSSRLVTVTAVADSAYGPATAACPSTLGVLWWRRRTRPATSRRLRIGWRASPQLGRHSVEYARAGAVRSSHSGKAGSPRAPQRVPRQPHVRCARPVELDRISEQTLRARTTRPDRPPQHPRRCCQEERQQGNIRTALPGETRASGRDRTGDLPLTRKNDTPARLAAAEVERCLPCVRESPWLLSLLSAARPGACRRGG